MKRLLAFLAALVLGSLTATQIAAQTVPVGAAASPSSARERVVIQVSTPDQRMWAQSLNYAENLRELYGKDNVEVEIVALGQGIGVLKLDSPLATRVADTLKSGVKVVACQVTMRRQKLQKEDMLSDIGYVPAGLGEVIKRQREGWAYIGG
jgi:hypothetical protein